MVDQQHAHLAPVIRVDGARRVEDRDAVLEGQPAAGTHLGLGALGEFQEKTGGNQRALTGCDHDGRVEVGAEIHACAVGGGVVGQGVLALVEDADGKALGSGQDHGAKGRGLCSKEIRPLAARYMMHV